MLALRALRCTVELDRENVEAVFWSAFFASQRWPGQLHFEAFVFGLHERDSPGVQTRDRRFYTPGIRFFRPRQPGRLDLEIEAALQAGKSRASARPDDQKDLDHFAVFGHVDLGYTVKAAWTPRIALQVDYASGDADPEDGKNGRFDTLFGARRFEFGPTGVYRAFARSNIRSPGLRVELRPHRTMDAFAEYRAAWLAQARDAWATSGVRDPTGLSGTFVGHQIEARVRWRPFAGNLTLEVGFAHTFLGRFATSAPNANDNGDPSYFYSQASVDI